MQEINTFKTMVFLPLRPKIITNVLDSLFHYSMLLIHGNDSEMDSELDGIVMVLLSLEIIKEGIIIWQMFIKTLSTDKRKPYFLIFTVFMHKYLSAREKPPPKIIISYSGLVCSPVSPVSPLYSSALPPYHITAVCRRLGFDKDHRMKPS